MKILSGSLVPVFICLAVGLSQAAGWALQPAPTVSNLYAVSLVTPDTWVAVGDGGTILRSTDAGVSWSSVQSPAGDALRGVAFNGDIGLIASFSGRIYRSTDAGASWTEQARPTHRILFSVAFDSRMAVATGEEGGIFVSLDNGLTWTQRVAGTASILFGISVFGDSGIGAGGQGTIVNTVDRGAGWGLQVMDPTELFFYASSLASATTGWIVGSFTQTGSVILRTDNTGFTWTLQTAPTTSILFGVSFADRNSGTAVGDVGAIIHTSNGGQDWTSQTSGVTQTLNAVSFADALLGIVVGNAGTILRTTTGGEDNAGVSLPAPGGRSGPSLGEGRSTPTLETAPAGPFRGRAEFRCVLPRPSFTSLKVFSFSGREVAVLLNGMMPEGEHVVSWDASNLPSGVYFSRLEASGCTSTRRLILVK